MLYLNFECMTLPVLTVSFITPAGAIAKKPTFPRVSIKQPGGSTWKIVLSVPNTAFLNSTWKMGKKKNYNQLGISSGWTKSCKKMLE